MVGSFANANDDAATDAVVAIDITRLRTKERENRTILTSGHSKSLGCGKLPTAQPELPRYLLGRVTPTKLPAAL